MLRGDTNPPAEASPNVDGAPPAVHGTLRPPLDGDRLALSNQELVARGYPPRPDPDKAPSHYARWLRQVSRPVTRVDPRKVPHPGVTFARSQQTRQSSPQLRSPTLPLPPPLVRPLFNSNWNTWSGAHLTNPDAQFF
ncbi:MAG: hypothetical protein ACLP4V_13785 [Methylocella sp.]